MVRSAVTRRLARWRIRELLLVPLRRLFRTKRGKFPYLGIFHIRHHDARAEPRGTSLVRLVSGRACEAGRSRAEHGARVREGRRTPAAYIISAMRSAIDAQGIILLFDPSGAAAGIARQGVRLTPDETGAAEARRKRSE